MYHVGLPEHLSPPSESGWTRQVAHYPLSVLSTTDPLPAPNLKNNLGTASFHHKKVICCVPQHLCSSFKQLKVSSADVSS